MSDATQGAPEGAPQENQEQQQAPQRPENVPEKFWNADTGVVNTEALLASYAELEKTRGKPAGEQESTEGAPAGEGESNNEQNPQGTEGQPTPYEQAVAKATEELQSADGKISDDTYAAFEKQGISRDQIDTYVDGQVAMQELRKIHVEREVGGEDAYSAMLAWAGANYSAEDAEAYNNSVFGANRDEAMKAARALKAKYEEAMGTDGKIVTDGTGATSPGGYTSKDEWLADLRKPEYKKNGAFRDEVRKKLDAAMKNGVNMGVGVSVG